MKLAPKFSPYFDPDEVVIDKAMLNKIIDAMIRRWKKNEKANFWSIQQARAFRGFVRLQSDRQINTIFREILRTINEIQYLGALARSSDLVREGGAGAAPAVDSLLELAIRRLEEGRSDIDKIA